MLYFILGAICGASVGVMCMALLAASSQADDRAKTIKRNSD